MDTAEKTAHLYIKEQIKAAYEDFQAAEEAHHIECGLDYLNRAIEESIEVLNLFKNSKGL
tara:strand:- start:562 stop:741 length:180 start_codon:yes stop_codon:yes gene_type:complete